MLLLLIFFIDIQSFIIIPYVVILGIILLIHFFTVDRKQKINVQNSILQKSITFLAISLYFIVITTIFYLIIFSSHHQTYTRPNDYSKALKLIKQQENISHFPTTIPKDASKIQLYIYTSDFNGEIAILKFKTNKNYIDQELKNHKFLNSNTQIGTTQNIYYIYTDNNRININNTTWYVIDNKNNRQIYPKNFPYYSSIGISNDMDFIVYYYVEPKD